MPYRRLVVESGGPPDATIDLDDPAFICYTSGTTGVQKGAVLTHRSVLHPAQAKALAEGVTWRDRMLVAVLMVSGAIEAFVTPSGLPTWARVGIGVLAEVAFFGYVFVVGRAAYLRGETGDVDASLLEDRLASQG